MTAYNHFLPRWTKRAVMDGSGRDPLGLSRVSDAFTGLLLPSIITTTNRARYYAFYPWAMRESCQSAAAGDSGPAGFVEELRKREAAFAVASKLGQRTDLPIVGIDQVNECVSEVSADEMISTNFRVLPAANMGGFGQYYGGCLQNLNLGSWDEDGFWRISENRGRKLADAFAASVSSTTYSSNHYSGKELVPFQVLKDSSNQFSLDAIRGDGAKLERDLLTDILFELDDDADPSGPAYRQATLAQLLHVIDSYESIGCPPTRNQVGDSCLYWPHYYGCLYGPEDVSVPYLGRTEFAENSAYWRQFCVHQFFTYAAEELLQAILDASSRTAEGLSKPELVSELLSSEFVHELEEVTGCALSGPASLLKFFQSGEAPEKVQEQFSANHELAEWWIYNKSAASPLDTRLGRAFAILAQLHAKWRLSDDEALWDVAEKAGGEWWVGICFEWGDRWLADQPSWASAVGELIEAVHERHELVKYQKHRLDAAWLEKIDGRYTKLQDLKPDFRANRHPNAVTILQDLCLLRDGGLNDALLLTPDGRKILHKVIRARS